jgi:hypothetical protein
MVSPSFLLPTEKGNELATDEKCEKRFNPKFYFILGNEHACLLCLPI